MNQTRILLAAILIFSAARCVAQIPSTPADNQRYSAQASEVTRYIQQNFYIKSTGLYRHTIDKPNQDFMWGNGVMFSALVGACRYEPDIYLPIMSRFFKAMDRYWDSKVAIPGYEPSPTNGNGKDKYYDDNEWMVLTFAEAFELTDDQQYLQRAEGALKFSLSGWDDQLGGGILWHETTRGQSKNTCSNAPAAAACLRMAKFLPDSQANQSVAMAVKIVDWTNKHLQVDNGLYADSQKVSNEKINLAKLTYNTALMIRSDLGLYRWTGDEKYLEQARRSSKAADWFLDKNTGAYRDLVRWSHLQIEADLEMYRFTHEDYLLARARRNADHYYATWKASPPVTLIDNASIARLLWLMADTESNVGKQFWTRADLKSK